MPPESSVAPPTSTAFITGATHGIGRATAFALGRAGYAVGVCARTAANVDALVAELEKAGIRAAGAAADVSQAEPVGRAVAQVTGALGEIGVLVNNAGVLIARPFEELTLDDWDATMGTNLRSLFLVTRAVLPGMRRRREGTVVNVASLAGRNGFAGGTAYSASKHAVLGFGRSLMLEVRKQGIRVITICPGSVDTAMLHDQPMLKSDPQRILRPEDLAYTLLGSGRLPGRAKGSDIVVRPPNP
jgi:3-oxoacyl-[acyl-carrier protein] reductase